MYSCFEELQYFCTFFENYISMFFTKGINDINGKHFQSNLTLHKLDQSTKIGVMILELNLHNAMIKYIILILQKNNDYFQ